jgi:hypothetical protein
VSALALLVVLGALTSAARSDEGETTARGLYGGMDLGVGVPAGGSAIFGTGFGSAFIFGYRGPRWRLQGRFGERYDLPMDSDVARVLDGSLEISSATLGYALAPSSPLQPVVAAGPALLSSSVVEQNVEGVLVATPREGVGLALSAGVEWPLAERLVLAASVHAYVLRWEQVGSVIVDSGGTSSLQMTNDPADGIPLTMGIGFRVVP